MAEIFSLPGDHSKERGSDIDALKVYDILDNDPILGEFI